ncbi:MAG: hypothetical protein K6G54_05035 [Oscillospiraceae bacterium]|nr:hypothetical protein [Oscillospiraceae bacterium]
MDTVRKMMFTDALTSSERSVANYILNMGSRVDDLSLERVARESFTSNATVVRMCRKLGFRGFRDFRTALRRTLCIQTGADASQNVRRIWLFPNERPDVAALAYRLLPSGVCFVPLRADGTADLSAANPETDLLLTGTPRSIDPAVGLPVLLVPARA